MGNTQCDVAGNNRRSTVNNESGGSLSGASGDKMGEVLRTIRSLIEEYDREQSSNSFNQRLMDALNDIQGQFVRIEKNIVTGMIENSKSKNLRLKKALDEALRCRENYEKLEEELSQEKIKSEKSTLELTIQQRDKRYYKAKLSESCNQVSRMQDQSKELNDRLIEEKERYSRIESQLRTERLENSENKKKMTSLLQRIDMEKQSAQFARTEIKMSMLQLQKENPKLKTELSESNNQVSKLQDHCKKLNERIIQEKGRTLRIESQLRTEGLENSENKKKITSLLQRIDMEKQSTQLTLSEMFQLQEENAELKTDLSQTYNELVQERAVWSTTEENLKSEIIRIQLQLDKGGTSKKSKKKKASASTNASLSAENALCLIEDSRPARKSGDQTVTFSPENNDTELTIESCEHDPKYKSRGPCQAEVTKKLDCGHMKETLCYSWRYERSLLICNEICEKSFECEKKHKCEEICGRPHSHIAENCPVRDYFRYPECGHTSDFQKACRESLQGIKCRKDVKFVCKNCGSQQTRKCHTTVEYCEAKVEFNFSCGHKAPMKKVCSEAKYPREFCTQMITYTSKRCGHQQNRQCNGREVCKYLCTKLRPDCKHPCDKECHVPCTFGDCKFCEIEYSKSLQATREAAIRKMELFKKEAIESDSKSVVLSTDRDEVEYSEVTETCQAFFLTYTQLEITVQTIKKCPPSVKYFDCFSKTHGALELELCKLVSSEFDFDCPKSLHDFLKEQKSKKEDPLYGFYKHAPPLDYNDYDLQNMTLIICDVLIGEAIDESKVTIKPKNLGEMREYLRQEERDSVMVSEKDGPARYRVFNRNQFRPKYIVKLALKKRKLSALDPRIELEDGQHVIDLSTFKMRDVSNPLCELVRNAVSIYNKGECYKRDYFTGFKYKLKKVKKVGIVVNHEIAKTYEDTRKNHMSDNGGMEEVYAYHATHLKNVESIIKTNLDPNRPPVHGRAYGHGCYFSEYPEFSMKYGQDCMLVFKLILVEGKYSKVHPDKTGFCLQLVLPDAKYCKPEFVLYF